MVTLFNYQLDNLMNGGQAENKAAVCVSDILEIFTKHIHLTFHILDHLADNMDNMERILYHHASILYDIINMEYLKWKYLKRLQGSRFIEVNLSSQYILYASRGIFKLVII